MKKRLTASKLRENVYRILDRVSETGEAVEILRNGKVLHIVPGEPVRESERPRSSKLEKLVKRSIISGDPEDLVHLDWSSEWKA